MSRINSRSSAPIFCVVAALIVTSSGRARALSCAEPGVIAPLADATQVPTNTLVWCTLNVQTPSSLIRLRDPNGADVSGTQTQLSMRGYDILVFRPSSELAANSQYTVDCPLRHDLQPSTVFSTGPGASTTPPAVPSLANVEVVARPDDGWGPSYLAAFRQVTETPAIVVVDVGGGASLNARGPAGTVSDATHLSSPWAMDIFVGTGPCGGSWPEARLGATTTVALGAFDLTGAFSGWSDTLTVTIPTEAIDRSTGEAEPDDEAGVGEAERDEATPDEATPDETTPDEAAELEPASAERNVPTDTGDDTSTPVRPSPLGRSGCALGARESRLGGTAGLLLALAGLTARRRRRT